MNIDIKKDIVEEKIRLIEQHLGRLEAMKNLSVNRLSDDTNFAATAWNLRSALESTFDICAHLLSRIPGVRVSEYKEMALEMGKQGIVSKEFADGPLHQMAGYRNRLTHFYFEVAPPEMYDIIQNHLEDFRTFMGHIKKLLI